MFPRPGVQRQVISNTYQKFIIVGKVRTGTTLLQSLLSSHEQIVSYGEVLHLLSMYFNGGQDTLRQAVHNPWSYISSRVYKDHPNHIKAVGFKTLYEQLGQNNVFLGRMNTTDVEVRTRERREAFSRFMGSTFDLDEARRQSERLVTFLAGDFDIKVIHMKRRNKLNTFLSAKLAGRSGAWNSHAGSYFHESCIVNPGECERFFEEVEKQERWYDELFQAGRMICVFYEDLCGDSTSWSRKIQEFLGVEYRDLSTALRKQNTLSIPERIDNYRELREAFRDTRWEGFFER